MADSPILKIPQIAENQNNKFVTHNNAIDYLEAAMSALLTKSTAGTTAITLTEDECVRYRYYQITTGTASGAFNLVFEGDIGSQQANREFVVSNESGQTITVKSDAAGTTVVLTTGQKALVRQDGDNMTEIVRFYGATVPYDFGLFISGLPEDGVECFKIVAIRAFDLADDFAGARGHVGVNPTATAAFDVLKNGSSIGSVSISTSGVFTFNTTGAGVSMAAGDRLSLTTPSPQDATLSNVAIFFLGTRTL